jgi:hypothetical protein
MALVAMTTFDLIKDTITATMGSSTGQGSETISTQRIALIVLRTVVNSSSKKHWSRGESCPRSNPRLYRRWLRLWRRNGIRALQMFVGDHAEIHQVSEAVNDRPHFRNLAALDLEE